MLGPGQADTLGAELSRGLSVERCFGVGANTHCAGLVGPVHQGSEVAGEGRFDHRHHAHEHFAGRAIQRDCLPGADDFTGSGQGLRVVVNRNAARAGDAGPAHAARHDGRMAGHPASGGQDALGGMHAMNILGACLDAHQDHRFASGRAAFRLIGAKNNHATGGAGACGKALS